MSINLKQLFESVGEVQKVSYQLDLSGYELYGGKPFLRPVQVEGQIANKAGVVFLEYQAGFSLETACDRCLESFCKDYKYSFEHILVTELNEENDEFIVLEDYQLDLDDLVLADILLQLPSKMLCRDDCRGLCEVCGTNRNEKSCDCKEKASKQVDPRLAVLGELLK